MSSDGTGAGPAEEWTRRSGRPPVPTPVSSETDGEDGQHRTERVPFPLPPLRSEDEQRPAAPRTEQLPAQPAPGTAGGRPAAPETGQLELGGYPPRVPGAGRPRAAAPVEADDDER
jgi:hypothetical protein